MPYTPEKVTFVTLPVSILSPAEIVTAVSTWPNESVAGVLPLPAQSAVAVIRSICFFTSAGTV